MEVRVLGAHNLESRNSRLLSLLIDGVLAVDAGSLSSALSFEEQKEVKAVILSHEHLDHIRDLATFGLAWCYVLSTPVYAPSPVLETLKGVYLSGKLYPDFAAFPQEKPRFEYRVLEPYRPEVVLGYTVMPIPVRHTALTVGYEITSPEGRKLFYSSDTGPGLAAAWPYTSPHLIITEVTGPNRLEEPLRRGGHLTPRLLAEELRQFREAKGYLPPVVLVHYNLQLREEIEAEVREVAGELGASIRLACDDLRLQV